MTTTAADLNATSTSDLYRLGRSALDDAKLLWRADKTSGEARHLFRIGKMMVDEYFRRLRMQRLPSAILN